ncbi:hypothetical protein CDD83_10631 [Cordyceps sp. RAO-2017]|nr:hypothetical protein CDD83_10631 [Cordyceps sp. RAO-2017]
MAVPLVHLALSPYSKVEESFNLQAAHDILVYGTPASSAGARLARAYDHFAFPGAVPRTFVGAVVLAGVAQPLLAGPVAFRHGQLLVRALLAAGNAAALLAFRNAFARAFGRGAARWWLVLMLSQFH